MFSLAQARQNLCADIQLSHMAHWIPPQTRVNTPIPDPPQATKPFWKLAIESVQQSLALQMSKSASYRLTNARLNLVGMMLTMSAEGATAQFAVMYIIMEKQSLCFPAGTNITQNAFPPGSVSRPHALSVDVALPEHIVCTISLPHSYDAIPQQRLLQSLYLHIVCLSAQSHNVIRPALIPRQSNGALTNKLSSTVAKCVRPKPYQLVKCCIYSLLSLSISSQSSRLQYMLVTMRNNFSRTSQPTS